jgi:medium-chain acyl-[acyl-carrier-protein] hydrolase
MSEPVRLFCLPWAGGSSAIYQRTWVPALAPDIEVRPLELPGHGAAWREKPVRRMEPLLDLLVPAVAGQLDRPYAVFGHSMGAVVGFELVRRLVAQGLPQPAHLLLSGSRLPGKVHAEGRSVHTMNEQDFRGWLRRTGGTPAEVFAYPELLEAITVLLRADIELVENHVFVPGKPLDCAFTVFGADEDPLVPLEDLDAWADLTTGAFDRVVLPGGHFAVNERRELVHEHIAAALSRSLVR